MEVTLPHTIHKNKFNIGLDLPIRAKTMKLSEENSGKALITMGLANISKIQKEQTIKGKKSTNWISLK